MTSDCGCQGEKTNPSAGCGGRADRSVQAGAGGCQEKKADSAAGCGNDSGKPTLVFSCSGAADTAEIADRAARKLHKSGEAKMYCLMGVGGNLAPIIETTRGANGILALDGCPQDCARHTLLSHGIESFRHLRLTDEGFPKGQSPATDERIEAVYQKALPILRELKGACCG